MKIKAKEIAAELGISPSTVSLALNDRPGISQKTKKQIIDYIRKKEKELWIEESSQISQTKGTVLCLNYIKNGLIMKQSERLQELNSERMASFQNHMAKYVTEENYKFEFWTFYEKTQNLEHLLNKCKEKNVKGIYLMAAEMTESDIYPFIQLKIPIVTGDNLFSTQGVDSYLIDNRDGISNAIQYLEEKGHRNIVYLAENIDIFNFRERRQAFLYEMSIRNLSNVNSRIWNLGSNIEEVYASMQRYLNKGLGKTTAFIMESSLISQGVCKALRESLLRVPRDISLIGFDSLPEYSIPGIDLTIIKGTHIQRHLDAICHLLLRMKNENKEIMKVYYRPKIIEGNTVFNKKKYIYT